jgi:DNA-binding protein YbaB
MTTSPFAEQLAQSVAALRAQQARVTRISQELAKATESATSRDRSVTVVVGGQGELREFQFHSEDYRSMPPAELSAILVQLCNQARQQVAQRATEALAPLTAFGQALRESITGGTPVEDLLGPLREARESGRPGRRYYPDDDDA